jgi:hypothetical protein
MKAIFLDIPVDRAGTTKQRQALLALREVVAAYKAAFHALRFPGPPEAGTLE